MSGKIKAIFTVNFFRSKQDRFDKGSWERGWDGLGDHIFEKKKNHELLVHKYIKLQKLHGSHNYNDINLH